MKRSMPSTMYSRIRFLSQSGPLYGQELVGGFIALVMIQPYAVAM